MTVEEVHHGNAFDPASITRPDQSLLTYYIMVAALTVIGFPIVVIPLLCKYYTLRYKFDDKGVSMAWGVLFHREIYLTYRRVQDIHVSRNLFHRWLGLASVGIQTASGSSGAEMTVEGIRNPESLRDFLYAQMRGARDEANEADSSDEALALLHEIRDELKHVRLARESEE